MLSELLRIFLFDPGKPLIFTRLYFWGFFLLVLLFYSFLYKRKPLRNTYLWLVSLFFYYKTGGLFLLILVFTTLADFLGPFTMPGPSQEIWRAQLYPYPIILAFSNMTYSSPVPSMTLLEPFPVINHGAMGSNLLLGTHFDIQTLPSKHLFFNLPDHQP
jgi:hypothetical protein